MYNSKHYMIGILSTTKSIHLKCIHLCVGLGYQIDHTGGSRFILYIRTTSPGSLQLARGVMGGNCNDRADIGANSLRASDSVGKRLEWPIQSLPNKMHHFTIHMHSLNPLNHNLSLDQ